MDGYDANRERIHPYGAAVLLIQQRGRRAVHEMTQPLLYTLAGVFLWGLSLYVAYKEGRHSAQRDIAGMLFDEKAAERMKL